MRYSFPTSILLLAVLLFPMKELYGQSIRTIFQDEIAEDSLQGVILEKIRNMPNIEVGKGITFQPQDKWYKMTMRFRMQNMVGLSFDDQFSMQKIDAQVKRLRLRFDGYIYSPKITYSLQLGFTTYDCKPLPNENMNIVRDAMVYYVPNSTWNIGFGQTKIKANRARINSSSALQFVDRSIVNSEFNIDRDFGLFGEYYSRLFQQVHIVARGSITTGDGRNFQSSANSGLAYTGRLELFPLGRFKSKGDIMEGDVQYEESPKMLLAGAYSYNDRAMRLKGESGAFIENDEKRDLSNYFVDFILKYRGFAFYADWMGRLCDRPFITKEDGSILQTVYTGNGLNFQTSYLFPSKWEVALRNSTLFPDKKIQSEIGYDYYNQSTIGVSRYLIGHNLKIQADASYNYKKDMPSDAYNRYEFRFQVELGF